MPTTLPIDFALNLAIGASFMLTSRRMELDSSPLRSASLWALLAFEVLIVVPVGVYLLVRFPEWSLMYVAESGALGLPSWGWAALYPIAAIGGYAVARTLLKRDRLWAALGFAGGGLVLAAAIAAFGYRQLMHVGTTAAFRDDAGLQPLTSTPLVWVLGMACAVMLGGWGMCLWRLNLMSRAWRAPDIEISGIAEPTRPPSGPYKRPRKSSAAH